MTRTPHIHRRIPLKGCLCKYCNRLRVKRSLRLLVTKKCDRECPDCCNKDWDLDNLLPVAGFSQYGEIMITGGEPLLNTDAIRHLTRLIRSEAPKAKIFLYTARFIPVAALMAMALDGITFTLHEQGDDLNFDFLDEALCSYDVSSLSLRLNVFKGITLAQEPRCNWIIKNDIEWIKNGPLPKNEEFRQMILF